MYKGTITVELGGISTADVGRETFGVIPGVPPGVAGLGFLFCRILRNSLKRPMIYVGPEGFSTRKYERRWNRAEIKNMVVEYEKREYGLSLFTYLQEV